MKSYLDLIPVSAKVHRKQTRMTRLCIVISIFLISAIFGMAEMFLQSQKEQAIRVDGAWHAAFIGLEEEQIALIKARPQVKTGAFYGVTNYRLDMDYTIEGTQTVLCGFDQSFLELFPGIRLLEGNFPEKEDEALVSKSVGDRLNMAVGEWLELMTPQGSLEVQISGFVEDTATMQKRDAFGVFMDTQTYLSHFQEATLKKDFVYYVEFAPGCRIQKTLEEIKEQLDIPEEAVAENAKLLGVLMQSKDNSILKLYFVAFILAVLVAFSGMLMILGSLNSNVAQRTEFFGLMRCLGATRKQVRQFVRKEALSWCRRAIPIGLILSTVVIWILCHMLKTISPTWFGDMPGFGVSWIGLAAGILIGLLTVLAASRTPAKKASGVSPLAAVVGNANMVFRVKRAANTRLFPIETALGIHHAVGSKKNLFLMTASFAFSIILFLSFSTGVDFMQHAITPLRPYTPDVSVVSKSNGCDIPDELFTELKAKPFVKRIFGRSFAYDLPMRLHGENKKAMLISYEEHQFGWAEGDLQEGSMPRSGRQQSDGQQSGMERVKNGEGVLLVEQPGFSAAVGDEIEIETKLGVQKVTVAGRLSYAPFSSGEGTGTLICSEELFRQLTGEKGYTILDIQLKEQADSIVEEIRSIAGENYDFSDSRASNREVRAVYFSFALFTYGFLAIVALIAVFNIINSMGMSVSARIYQYGAMRAIGAGIRQLKFMVAAEAFTYLICGLIVGLGAGLPLHRFLYQKMITDRWGDIWSMPVAECCIIASVMLVSAIMAIAWPVRRIARLSVVETIRSL